MATPRRLQIIQTARTRLLAITVANGYATDAGLALQVGMSRPLGDDDPDVGLALLVAEDTVGWQRPTKKAIALPLEIHALARASITDPYLMAETVLGDIKRAIEIDHDFGGLADHTFKVGSTRTLERDEGSTDIGIVLPYVVGYYESWGSP